LQWLLKEAEINKLLLNVIQRWQAQPKLKGFGVEDKAVLEMESAFENT
jgi:hypothetical protein